MAEFGFGMPLQVGDLASLYKGKGLSNGFLMRNIDGHLAATLFPVGRCVVANAHALKSDDIIPFGNGVWRDNAAIEDAPGRINASKPATKGEFVGVLAFNQGWQAGHPIASWGVPSYSKMNVIHSGLVGFKSAKAVAATAADYIAYLKGDATKDIQAVRTDYKSWVRALAEASDGSKLALFFEDATGFPVVGIYNATAGAATNAKAKFKFKNNTGASITVPADTYTITDGSRTYSWVLGADQTIAGGAEGTESGELTATVAGVDGSGGVGVKCSATGNTHVVLPAGITISMSAFTQGKDAEGPTLANCTFAGYATVFEKENGAVFFELGK